MPKRLTREESRLQTRQRLLEAATTLFAHKGFQATSIEEITEAAGYSRGAFYANFSDKDALFLALFDLLWEQLLPRWSPLFLEEVEPEQHRQHGEALLKQEITRLASEENGTWLMLLLEFILYAFRDPQAHAKLVERYRENFGKLAHLLAHTAGHRSAWGGLSETDRAWILHTLFLGMATHIRLDEGATPERAWVLPLAVILGESTPLQSRDIRDSEPNT